jgi:hypothetical protein
VVDVTISATIWGSRLFPVYGPRQYIHAAGGIAYYPITSAIKFRPAITTALESGRLSLLEVDMAAIGPYRIPFAGYALSN